MCLFWFFVAVLSYFDGTVCIYFYYFNKIILYAVFIWIDT